MLSFMKLYAVEILSIVMGLWLLWIIIIYSAYIQRLKRKNTQEGSEATREDGLQKAKNERKQAYTIAVTFPSYVIFWVVVAIWGLSYIRDGS